MGLVWESSKRVCKGAFGIGFSCIAAAQSAWLSVHSRSNRKQNNLLKTTSSASKSLS
jgi:hypothetical protein